MSDPTVDELRQRVVLLEQEVQTRDRALQDLREEVARLRVFMAESQWLIDAVENSDDFFGIGGLDGGALYVNPAGRRLVGLDSLADVRRTQIPGYFLPEDLPFVESTIVPEVLGKGIWRGEFRFRHFKTGAPIPVYYVLFAIRDRITDQIVGLATVTQDLTARKRLENERTHLQDEIIRAKDTLLAELSTPLIPITDKVVVMPLIGAIDAQRAEQMLETLLAGIAHRGASTVILDVTGVKNVDAASAAALLRSARAVRLLGAQLLLSGLGAELAQTLVQLDLNIGEIPTYGSLQSAIEAATRAAPSESRREPTPTRRQRQRW